MARDDAMARTQTTLVEQSTFSQQGFPGRYFSSRNLGGGVMNSRLILARKRLYMLTATFPTAGARRDEDVARFFSSFTVVAHGEELDSSEEADSLGSLAFPALSEFNVDLYCHRRSFKVSNSDVNRIP
jgi:hypothetical protein